MAEYYLGYSYKGGARGAAQRLVSAAELKTYLKAHLYDEEVVITDPGDNLLFRALDGVDLYSELDELGIDLPALYREVRQKLLVDAAKQGAEREPWEEYYDSIGLSPGEIQMRQQAKRLCKAAQTVEDVARLLEGTYFDAYFHSEDRQRAWGYFNPEDYSIDVLEGSEEEGWGERQDPQIVTLNPKARIKHISSSEDVHRFTLYDPPEG
ncbi:MAG: hypothetical protein U9R58_10920 [Chloroflexota bacterium]|nr:hypothetical protein [Chloroflexota bacterium]